MAFFDSAYPGVPPWDIGRPQTEFARLAESREIRGTVLDVGCGTGENALYLAELGHGVWGIDASPKAIARAKAKATQRQQKATFLVVDALELQRLKRRFDAIIDCGLFHIFSDDERRLFVESLASALRVGGSYHMLCFSEHEPSWWGGPRRVTQAEIRTVFRGGWRINYIREARFESRIHGEGGKAWLSSMAKL